MKDVITVKYGEFDLSLYFLVSNVTMPFLYKDNQSTRVGRSDGEVLQYSRNPKTQITIQGTIITQHSGMSVADTRDKLMGYLNARSTQRLVLSNYPDRYFNAIFDGTKDYDGTFDYLTTVSLVFIVPDGVAHSLTTATVSGQSGTDITVTNGGTAPTAPVLTATMSGDNGVVAWTNDAGGVLQFGANDEIDGMTKERSEQVYHYTFDSEPTDVTLNDGVVAYPLFNGSESMPNQQTGPFDYTRTPGTATPASVRTADMFWSGPSMSGKLPVNSAGKLNGNFQWVNRMKFLTTKNATGRCEFNLTKGDEVVVSLLLYDNSRSTDMLMFEGTVNGQHLFLDNLPRSYYKNDEYDLVITKLGSQVTFRINRVTLGGGGVETRTVANFDASEIDGWTVWLTGFSDDPGWTMNWEDSYFNWINVDYWSDIPNRFKAGDVVKADISTHTVLLNGAEDPTLDRVGNDWSLFELPAGDSTLRLTASSWATGVTGKVEYRKAWY